MRPSRPIRRSRSQRSDGNATAIDAEYGLDPVIEPGADAALLGDFATVDCPYCGERFGTSVDLSAGSFCYVEDCQICCQPIELTGHVDAAGLLSELAARRLD